MRLAKPLWGARRASGHRQHRRSSATVTSASVLYAWATSSITTRSGGSSVATYSMYNSAGAEWRTLMWAGRWQ
eukprot:2666130-Pyramimonas_sp.AAC.1